MCSHLCSGKVVPQQSTPSSQLVCQGSIHTDPPPTSPSSKHIHTVPLMPATPLSSPPPPRFKDAVKECSAALEATPSSSKALRSRA